MIRIRSHSYNTADAESFAENTSNNEPLKFSGTSSLETALIKNSAVIPPVPVRYLLLTIN
jgi:hypothetical protein